MGPSETFSMRVHYHGIIVSSETEVPISDDWQSYQLSHCSTNASFATVVPLLHLRAAPLNVKRLFQKYRRRLVAGINGIVPKRCLQMPFA
ncbi:hypothetical protein CEXT_404571 [Caerostris extrusa]|uniref:Uncharacterized protein n=1 Tax=Caerostris extrusa TaxID=172846 RepID=A0AAV4N615_CAEEX|nr:hypothetical protein CEXT_404571 [Caerostris extrusa]